MTDLKLARAAVEKLPHDPAAARPAPQPAPPAAARASRAVAGLSSPSTEVSATIRRPCPATIGPASAAMLPLSKPPLNSSPGARVSRRTRHATASSRIVRYRST